MDIVILFLLLLVMMWSLLMLYRNGKVCNFRIELNERCYNVMTEHINSIPAEGYTLEKQEEHMHLRSIWHSISDISYDKMLYQFWKPLKEEVWLNKEQIDFLNGKY